MTVPEKEISQIQPLMTVLSGKITYLHPDFAARLDPKLEGAVVATYKELTDRRSKRSR